MLSLPIYKLFVYSLSPEDDMVPHTYDFSNQLFYVPVHLICSPIVCLVGMVLLIIVIIMNIWLVLQLLVGTGDVGILRLHRPCYYFVNGTFT